MDKRKVAMIGGGLLLLWWYFKGRGSSSSQSTADPMAGVTNMLTSLGGAKASSNPLSDFQSFLGLTNSVAQQKKPVPPADSWVFTDQSGVGWNIQSLASYDSWFKRWGDSKCTDKSGAAVPCDSVGYPCIRGVNCLPGDPGFQKPT